MNRKYKLIGCLLFFIIQVSVNAQSKKPELASFEKQSVLKINQNNSSIVKITEEHAYFGKKGLKWQWDGNGWFSISNFRLLNKEDSSLSYGDFFPASPTFIFSVYNEIPQDGNITISFKKDSKSKLWFDLPIHFKGWRHFRVPFYEMEGDAPKKGDPVKFSAFKVSTKIPKGTLFFDDIVFSQYQDDRHAYPDMWVPFIKAKQSPEKDHWMPRLDYYKRIKALKPEEILDSTSHELKKIENKISKLLISKRKPQADTLNLFSVFNQLNIFEKQQVIYGPPLTFKQDEEYFNNALQGAKNNNDIRHLGIVLKDLASYYHYANARDKLTIKKAFVLGTKYYLDQGWQGGASGGTRHHIGYNVREIAEAFFIMKEVLSQEGLLNDVGASLHWLFNLGMVLDDPENYHVNLDYLNTQSFYHLVLIYLVNDKSIQAQLLKAYSNYMSIILAQQNEEWGFKIDGTSWHHSGHYPAYAVGAFTSVPKIIHTLSGTRFRIREEGHKNFKTAFLASRIYCHAYQWGFGNAGRHPLEKFHNNIESLKTPFLLMAKAGNPEGDSFIDKEAAAAYLRLWGKTDKDNVTFFNKKGITKERLQGYNVFPYAATAVHRRNDWAAIIKGYSKYVWASEIYVASNRYGRYPANGTIQLLKEQGELASGFAQEGWDWNRYPGATVVYLPFKDLEAESPLLMFRSNETFAGATTLDGDGVFGMVLNEENGTNAEDGRILDGFSGKLKAKKSVFSFGNKLICIGTNISSIDTLHPIHTNLFQTNIQDVKQVIYTANGVYREFPLNRNLEASKLSNEKWIADSFNTVYYMLGDNRVMFNKSHQKSFHNKYSIKTKRTHPLAKGETETEGDFSSAWIDHGVAPKNAAYSYAIYPFLSNEKIKTINKDTSFSIIQADSMIHSVTDYKTNTTGYVIFNTYGKIESDILKSVSMPSILMIKKEGQKVLKLSLVQPDLNFPEYQKGKYKNYSTPLKWSMVLNGIWELNTKVSKVVKVDYKGETTCITLMSKDGLPVFIDLQKK